MRRLTLALAFLPLAACASMTRSADFMVPVDSTPDGAAVRYRGARVGRTPCTVAMRPDATRFTLELDGHHPHEVDAGSHVNPALFGNLLVGGAVGLMVDGASGNSMQISTRPILVELVPLAQPAPVVWVRPKEVQKPDEGWTTVPVRGNPDG